MSKTSLKGPSLSPAGGLSLLCAAAQADCAYPKAPAAIPNGTTASGGELSAAAAAFKQYHSEVTAYLACLQEETAARSASSSAAHARAVEEAQFGR